MSSGSSQQPVQTTTNVPGPQQQQLFNTVFPQVQQWAAQGPPQAYQGPMVAPISPQTEAGYNEMIQAARAQQNPALLQFAERGVQDIQNQLRPFTGVDPFSGFTMQDIRGDLNWDPLANERMWNPAMNPALNQAIMAAQRPLYQQLTEQTLPQIRGGAVTAGGVGGSRQGIAEGLAAGRTAQAAGDVGSRMAMDAYNNNLNAMVQTYLGNINALNQRYGTNVAGANQRYGTNVAGEQARYGQNIDAQLRAYGLAPQIAQAQTTASLLPAAAQIQYGDLLQRQNQAQIASDIARYNYGNLAPFLQAQEVLSLGQGFGGGSTTSTANVPQANPWMQSLGGAAAGASVGSVAGPPGALAGAGVGAMLPFIMR